MPILACGILKGHLHITQVLNGKCSTLLLKHNSASFFKIRSYRNEPSFACMFNIRKTFWRNKKKINRRTSGIQGRQVKRHDPIPQTVDEVLMFKLHTATFLHSSVFSALTVCIKSEKLASPPQNHTSESSVPGQVYG